MNNMLAFTFEEDTPNTFESFSKENGSTYWWASDLMLFLGYESNASFKQVINKAIATCTTLNIGILDNFNLMERVVEGRRIMDFKLSRFACYLISMNGDNKKQGVALAQAYFATIAGAVESYLEEVNQVERLLTREEVSEREKSLSAVAKLSGVTSYPLFQNAGYRGMYNMNLSKLKELRGIESKRSPLDYMGKTELAANLFRITQTELKIKNENIKGQPRLEVTAETVGLQVRKTMLEISGVEPENLPLSEDIKEVKKKLKSKSKELKSMDKKKRLK